MELRTRVLAVAGAAATLVGLAVAPAAAEHATYADPADATASPTDIRRVTVNHGPARVKVKARFTDLRRTSPTGASGLTVLIDTRGSTSGPDFKLTSGLESGTDYQLIRLRNGRPVGEPLTCPHQVQLQYGQDRLLFSAARSCLGDPARVRIGARMLDEHDGSHPVKDWLGEPRSFTRWLARD